MYKLLKRLSAGIWYNPVFYGRHFIANGKDKRVRVYDVDTLNVVKELSIRDIDYITIEGNNLFLETPSDTYLLNFNNLSSEAVKMPGVRALPSYINNQSIFFNYQTESGSKIAKYNYRNFALENLFEGQIGRDIAGDGTRLVFSEKNFFARKIFCIAQTTGQMFWVLDVSDLGKTISNNEETKGKIVGPLKIKDEKLIVAISGDKLLEININTGNLLWQRESTNDRLQLYGDRLVNVDASWYREISLETGETLMEFDMEPEYEKHGFRFMGTNSNFTVTDTHVFIVDAMGYMLGSINRSLGKIDWSVDVGDRKVTLPHAPIIYEDRLYVLCDEGTLYIYERGR